MLSIGQPEVSFRLHNIFEYLGPQRLRRGPFDLGAQAKQELELERSLIVEIDWHEIKNVRLDCERSLAKRGPISYIRHRPKAALLNPQPRDVDAESRQQAGIRSEIHRWHQQPRADTSPTRWRGVHCEG